MEHKFRDVSEHDMDLLILEEFSYSGEFAKIFLDKIGVTNASVVLTWQSKTDSELGESDMTVVCECGDKKIGLLIEDKIDAVAMPEQPARYILRGNKGVLNGEYDAYYIFIVAPQAYLEKNEKAKEYPDCVSYEEIKAYFEKLNDLRSGFKLAQINMAIDKQKKGYQAIKNVSVTDFWKKYVEFGKTHYPNLAPVNSGDVKPVNGVWVCFRTNDTRSRIYYKSNKGNVDLTFNGQAENVETIKSFVLKITGDYYNKGFSIVKTGKSCAIRKIVPIVDFSKPFEKQIENVKQSFVAVEELVCLANRLDMHGIYAALSS